MYVMYCSTNNSSQASNASLLRLAFSLARGDVSAILNSLLLVSCVSPSAESKRIENSLLACQKQFWRMHCRSLGESVSATLLYCDGGQKNADTAAANVLELAGNYISAEGKLIVNLVFKMPENIRLCRVHVKVPLCAEAPRRVLVFVLQEHERIEELVGQYDTFNTWSKEKYSEHVSSAQCGRDGPVAFLELSDCSEENAVYLDLPATGKVVLVKLVEPQQSTATSINISNISFYGIVRKTALQALEDRMVWCNMQQDENVALNTLLFLLSIMTLQEEKEKQSVDSSVAPLLNIKLVSLARLWQLYQQFQRLEERVACLLVLHHLLPKLASEQNDDASAKAWFTDLCRIVDSSLDCTPADLQLAARHTIIDGAAVFFTSRESRRQCIMSMISDLTSIQTSSSVMLTFSSLCHFIGNVDPGSLLDLPTSIDKTTAVEASLSLVSSLVSLTHVHGSSSMAEPVEVTELVLQLLSSLQTYLLFWCKHQLSQPVKKRLVEDVITQYLQIMCDASVKFLLSVESICSEDLKKQVPQLEKGCILFVMHKLASLLLFVLDDVSGQSRQAWFTMLMSLCRHFDRFTTRIAALQDGVSKEPDLLKETMLKVWTVESNHNYENNELKHREFSCSGAQSFIIEFDSHCETEPRCDTLEFVSSSGAKVVCDGKVDCERWPLRLVMKGANSVRFTFKSDGSRTEWGYKFKITAYGLKQADEWFEGLEQSLSYLLGRTCSSIIGRNECKSAARDTVITSDLWNTLLRGGYVTGKLQRSLSGKYASDVEPVSIVNFLTSMTTLPTELNTQLVQRIKEQHKHSLMIGDEAVNQAVLAVFAALLWHSQSCREDLEKFIRREGNHKFADCVVHAYTMAESIRMPLIEQCQKIKAQQVQVPVDPCQECAMKAQFLLKFAGLAKMESHSETKKKGPLSRMVSTAESILSELERICERNPSFRFVLQFINDPAWSPDKVEELMKERSSRAALLAQAYLGIAEYLQLAATSTKVGVVRFLQGVLHQQDRFPQHYADSLDGCGLYLENSVRGAFYTIVRRLLDITRPIDRSTLTRQQKYMHDSYVVCLLHLLHIDWQPYDVHFINEVKLPQTLIGICKGYSCVWERVSVPEDHAAELSTYSKCMTWLDACRKNFSTWYSANVTSPDTSPARRDGHLFVGRYCEVLPAEITCDGCHVTCTGPRYHCLQCEDLDICFSCFLAGVRPRPDQHSTDHTLVLLSIACSQCSGFIMDSYAHCEACADVNLCWGCYDGKSFPRRHTSEHAVVLACMPVYRQQADEVTDLLPYVHRLSWLMFVHVSFSLAAMSHKSATNVDADYLHQANVLVSECVSLACSHVSTDSSSAASDKTAPLFHHGADLTLGFLACLLRPDSETNSILISDLLLRTIFHCARTECIHAPHVQHMALTLFGHILCIATDISQVDALVCQSSNISKEGASIGYNTVQYLFQLGVSYYKRGSIDLAYSVASVIQSLAGTTRWLSAVQTCLSDVLHKYTLTPQESGSDATFALLLVSGFPELFSIGCSISYVNKADSSRQGVLLRNFRDRNIVLVVEMKTHKRYQVKADSCRRLHSEQSLVMCQSLAVILSTHIISALHPDVCEPDDILLLSVVVKCLLVLMKDDNCPLTDASACVDLLPPIVRLARQQLEFSVKWHADDLEPVALMLSTSLGELSDKDIAKLHGTIPELAEKAALADEDTDSDDSDDDDDDEEDDDDDDDNDMNSFETASAESLGHKKSATGVGGDQALVSGDQVMVSGASDQVKVIDEQAKVSGDQVMIGAEVLVVPDASGIREADVTTTTQVSTADTAQSLATDKGSSESSNTQIVPAGGEPTLVVPAVAPGTDSVEGVDEVSVLSPELLLPENAVKVKRRTCADVRKNLLKLRDEMKLCDNFSVKVNMALLVLRCRQLLAVLLARLPQSASLSCQDLLGSENISALPSCLDFLNTVNTDTFSKAVSNIVSRMSSQDMFSVIMKSAELLSDASTVSKTVESKHPIRAYSSYQLEDSIHIANASSLLITFDSRSKVRGGSLLLATSADFSEDTEKFSDDRPLVPLSIPGDRVFYKFENAQGGWGVRFTVSAEIDGRSNTGYQLLLYLLSQPSLPSDLELTAVWSRLIGAACRVTGRLRLKVIRLLLCLLQHQQKRADVQSLAINLPTLKPLWKLLERISNGESNMAALSPLSCALTELFFVADQMAADCNISHTFRSEIYC